MIFNFTELQSKYSLDIKGIIHIGGHYGEEYELYKPLDIPILFFEPLSNNFNILQHNIQGNNNVRAFQCALGNDNKKTEMWVETANQGQSSSILKPKKS